MLQNYFILLCFEINNNMCVCMGGVRYLIYLRYPPFNFFIKNDNQYHYTKTLQ